MHGVPKMWIGHHTHLKWSLFKKIGIFTNGVTHRNAKLLNDILLGLQIVGANEHRAHPGGRVLHRLLWNGNGAQHHGFNFVVVI